MKRDRITKRRKVQGVRKEGKEYDEEQRDGGREGERERAKGQQEREDRGRQRREEKEKKKVLSHWGVTWRRRIKQRERETHTERGRERETQREGGR